MKRMMTAGACALALLGVAGCSDTNSWYGGSGGGSTMSGTTAAPGTSGSSGVVSGSDTSGSTNTMPSTGRVDRRGAGVPVDPSSRNGAYYPGTLSGEGQWHGVGDAPGGG